MQARQEASPWYGKWWFWTAVGAVAIGAGAGAYVATRPGESGSNELVITGATSR
jgi:hypothetical protein